MAWAEKLLSDGGPRRVKRRSLGRGDDLRKGDSQKRANQISGDRRRTATRFGRAVGNGLCFCAGWAQAKREPRTNNRRFLNAFLWMGRSGGRWRSVKAVWQARGVMRRGKVPPDGVGPLGDSDQAADLTAGRGLRSSNCCGLR
jgi:hypothetical protein